MPRIPGIRPLFRFPRRAHDQIENDVDDELRFHLEMRTRELIAGGMAPDAARDEARGEFGDIEYTRRYLRDADSRAETRERRSELLGDAVQDARFAVRQLRGNPGFTAAVILTLAIGIGATTAIFGVVDGVLLEPLPYTDADRVVVLWQNNRAAGNDRDLVSPANFLDWRERATAFTDMAAMRRYGLDFTGREGPESVDTWLVSDGFFRVLGTPAHLGRTLRSEDHVEGRDRVVVLAFAAWQRRFGGDPQLVGRTIPLDGEPYTVVGVMPADLEMAGGGELWSPLVMGDAERQRRASTYLSVVARLRPGATAERASAELATIAERLSHEHPRANGAVGISMVPLADHLLGEARPALLTLLGAVALLLLIACANVANLLLARAVKREREFAIRASLGAGRGRVIRQLLAESALLALLGGMAGVVIVYWGIDAIRALAPSEIPRIETLAIDIRLLGFALAVSLGTALLLGLAPALRMSLPELHSGLRSSGRSAGTGRSQFRLRSALVVSQLALAIVLLTGAGLLARSFLSLVRVERGYGTERVLALTVQAWGNHGYDTPEKRALFVRQAVERLAAIPGVRFAGMTSSLPLSAPISANDASIVIEGHDRPEEGHEPTVDAAAATAGYFESLGIALRAGRLFGPSDDAGSVPVMLINESMARRFWPNDSPLGKRAAVSFAGSPITREIIGVVGDVRHAGLDQEPRPALFIPHAQSPGGGITFALRTTGDPLSVLQAAKEAVWSLNKLLPFDAATTLDELLAESLRERRFNLFLLGTFSVTALILAAIGIYGVISHATGERTHEIGLRMALGARTNDVLRMVLRQGMTLALVGVIVGVLGALGLTGLLRGMLFGVTPFDVPTFAGLSALVLAVATVACYLPARRAARVDPVEALRNQ
ncbi:MAG: ABC transporter permease [Gemmatimonadota bacterium]|nr:ABC transporter permease [Gemmatimonadota bacterium]